MQNEKRNMISNQECIYLKNQNKKSYTIFINKDILYRTKYILTICFIIVFSIHFELLEINNEIRLFE